MSDDINSENMKSENERILFPQEPIPEEHFHVISPARMVMKRFFRSKLSIVGLTMIIFVFIFIPQFQYMAVIFCEPVIWCVMCLQLVYSLYTNPYMKGQQE